MVTLFSCTFFKSGINNKTALCPAATEDPYDSYVRLEMLFQVAAPAEVFCRDAKHASVAVGVRIVAGNAGELVVSERKRSYLHGGNDADFVFCWSHSVRVAFDAELGKRFF